MKSVLISGASIAGPALAWWLHRCGFKPTLVEKFPGPRDGGHAIDVRGAALRVLQAMGLAEQAQAKRTQMKGVCELDADGNEIWRSEEFTISGGSFKLEAIEILRDDLSRILVRALSEDIEIIYGDSVVSLTESDDSVAVTFESGIQKTYELVFGADGLPSSIRKLAFGPNREFIRPFDKAIGLFSSPNIIGLKDWQINYRDGNEGCTVYTVPGNGRLRVSFSFDAKFEDVPQDRASQVALVREKCGHLRWHAPRFMEVMESAPDFYLGSLAQVRMDHWTRGRIALVGDAGYCPSPYTGQGTSLAIVGAYVMARELALSPDDHAVAFARYEEKLRPFVEENQAIADLTRDERLSDPDYYLNVVEPALEKAKDAIELDELD